MPKTPHSYQTRVYYADTDAAGVVYHANYLHFAERARVEFLRTLGHGVADITRDFGLIFALRKCDIDFLSPARLDDVVTVETQIVGLGGASFDIRQTMRKWANDSSTDLAELAITLVAVNPSGKAIRIPDPLRESFQSLLQEKDIA